MNRTTELKLCPTPEGEYHFSAANKTNGVFSNLYRRAITFEGLQFPTSEHAYQAGKPRRKIVREWLLNAPTPWILAEASHHLPWCEVVPKWSKLKLERMSRVLHAKFTQHEDFRQFLLSTENARIVEVSKVNNAVNRYWGKVNGQGENHLGQLLMELRGRLRS